MLSIGGILDILVVQIVSKKCILNLKSFNFCKLVNEIMPVLFFQLMVVHAILHMLDNLNSYVVSCKKLHQD